MANNPKFLRDLQAQIAAHLDDIGKLFKNPKITLVVRNSDVADADVVLSDDDLELAIKAIRHLQENASHILLPTERKAGV